MNLKIWTAILALAPAAGALAANSADDVRALRTEVAALQLDRALNLTRDQAQALLPVLQNASAQAKARRAQVEASRPALAAALSQAVADLKSTGSISPATQQALAAARGTGFATARADMKVLRAQVEQILTPQQVQALKSAPLWAKSAPDAGVPAAKAGHGPGRRFAVLRTLTSDPFVALVQARIS